jgi:hypothetical protein
MAKLQLREFAMRGLLRDATIVLGLLFSDMHANRFAAGMAIFAVGAALHFWSKGVLVRNWVLTTTGPYRAVRHPFYLANLIIDLGICLISGNLYLLAAYVPLYLLTYIPTIRREEAFLRGTYGPTFDEYALRVPPILPRNPARFIGPWDFSWDNIRSEHELARLLRILAVPLLFAIEYLVFHTPPEQKGRIASLVICVAAVVAFNAASLLARRQAQKAFWSDLLP